MDKDQPRMTRAERIARLDKLIVSIEAESARLAKLKERPERDRRKLAWNMAIVFSDGALLKQTETLGRAYLALRPLAPAFRPNVGDFVKLSEKGQGYLRCKNSCRRFRNRSLRDACISYCILLAVLCITPDTSPN